MPSTGIARLAKRAPFFASSEIHLEDCEPVVCVPQRMVNKERTEMTPLFASMLIYLGNPAAVACVPPKDSIFLERERRAPSAAWDLVWFCSGWQGYFCVCVFQG